MVLIEEARASLASFISGFSLIAIPFVAFLSRALSNVVEDYLHLLLVAHGLLTLGGLSLKYKADIWQVAIRGWFLGILFGLGVLTSWSGASYGYFGWYMAVFCFFHWSEYFVTAVTNPRSLSLDDYMLDHSREYHIAAVASWVEFWLEWFIFPGLKQFWLLSTVGLILVVGGEILRKDAMFTAKSNFNHYVQHRKAPDHVLVTHGIYSLCRHPSYVGWFYWSIGTQLLLCNPFCVVGYTWISWKFFKDRIENEEVTLLNFFGEDYLDYQKQVRTGLPFIKGYRMEL